MSAGSGGIVQTVPVGLAPPAFWGGAAGAPTPSAWAALVVGTLPGAALASLAAWGWLDEQTTLALFVPSYVGLNAMHMAGTWSRASLTPGLARSRPIATVVIPCALAAAALVLEALGFAVALLGLQYYLSIHHGAMQHYGFVRASQRASGRTSGRWAVRADQAACVLPLMAALTHRARAVSAVYDGAPIPRPPEWLVEGLAAAAVLSVAAFVVRELAAWARGERVEPLGPAVALVATGTWTALIVAVEHPALPFFALASGHYLQYLWAVDRIARPRPEAYGVLPPALRLRVHPAHSTRGHLVFLAALGGLGIAGVTVLAFAVRALATALELRPADAMDLPPWGAAMIAVNLHHYWLDHTIWRTPPRPGTT